MAERTLATPAKRWATEYETIYILRPNVDPDDAAKVAKRVQDVMERTGAKITKVETWGKRKLAYLIKKHSRGIFVYVRFVAFNDVVAELERNLRLVESVVRYQTVKVRGLVELEDVQVDAEETVFEAIEQTEEEAEPTTAQRLGMEAPRSESDDDDATEESAAASGESAEEGAQASGEGTEEGTDASGEGADASGESTEDSASEGSASEGSASEDSATKDSATKDNASEDSDDSDAASSTSDEEKGDDKKDES